MENADKWVHPTRYSGEYPDGWAGYTFLDYDKNYNTYHPGEDYNWGIKGDDDLGQAVVATASGIIVFTSKAATGYGNMIVIKHTLGYNLKRFIKETYGIDTNELYSLYAHLQDILVSVGNKIDTGALIAHVGKTGTQWPHLHSEIYAPIGELAQRDFRFYPTVDKGWTKEKVKQYYLPAYKFIEATKQLEDLLDTFLGKSKDYWLQVEKDRTNLLNQIGEIEKKWSLKLEENNKQHEIEISNLNNLVLEAKKAQEKAEEQAKLIDKNFNNMIEKKNITIEELKKENNRLIGQNAENFKFWESIKIAINIFLKNIGVGR